MPARLTLPAPAKLNLMLHILGRRADGYHELQTLFQFLEHGDELSFALRSDGQICLHGELSDVPLDSESRLAKLEQDDWQVEYLSYVEQNGYWLPERMKLHGANLDITLVIKDWQPRQLGQ